MAAESDRRLRVTARGEREIVMTRRFAAPPRLVFDAFTRADLLPRWFGAFGWTVPLCEIDLRPGGRYRHVLRGPDGQEVEMRGEYLEVSPPDRLVATESWGGFSEVGWRPEDANVTSMLLTSHGEDTLGTSVITYPSREIRDGALMIPMEKGLGEGLDRLERLLAELS